jgi:hypothetical protein
MPALTIENGFYVMLAIVGFWFTVRFVIGPKRGAPRFGAMFGREKPVKLAGVGKEAIATLLQDISRFMARENAMRGLILAGPFAGNSAEAKSIVTLVAVCEDLSGYIGKEWVENWQYPARGHAIIRHEIVVDPGMITHDMTLRGAPALVIHFVRTDASSPPERFSAALEEGSQTLEDSTGVTEKLRRNWADVIARARNGAA